MGIVEITIESNSTKLLNNIRMSLLDR